MTKHHTYDKMVDIMVKNGYNGFYNTKKMRGNNQGKHSSSSSKLPPLETRKDDFVLNEEAPLFPVLQPSISDRITTETDIIILLDDEVRRIHQLSINLGIKHRFEVAEYQYRFHNRAKLRRRLPKIEGSKQWRQSHNWKKRMESETGFDLKQGDTALGKNIDTSSVDLNSLPRGRKKLLEPVDIPALGCSYRLPVLKKHKRKTGK